jgi:hypothetical protein
MTVSHFVGKDKQNPGKLAGAFALNVFAGC